MNRYAKISAGTIIEVIEAMSDPDGMYGEWIACGDAGPGYTFDGVNFFPPAPPVQPVKPYLRFIDIGPFNDRFGAKKLAILMSTDPIIKAFNSDKSDRHWVDLDRADVRAAVFYMAGVPLTVAPGQTITISTPILTNAEATAVMDTAVVATEQLALVKTYFS